jgi:hypothetical protein
MGEEMIDLGSVVNQGLIGMQKSQSSMAQSAQQIAQAGIPQVASTQNTSTQNTSTQYAQPQDLAEPLINLKIQSQVFDSSARVIKSADETIGTLLDIRA